MGAFTVGCYCGSYLISIYRKKVVLFFSYFLTFISSLTMYTIFKEYSHGILFFALLIGFFHGIIPGAFAVYFPELFPTKIRSTAKGFCFNIGRALAGVGVLFSGYLVEVFSGNIGKASAIMSFVFLVGAVVSLFAPDTDSSRLPA